jgi:hypothetical protein
MCFAITELPTQLPVGLSAALVFLLTCWCIFASWDWTENLSTLLKLKTLLLEYWQSSIERLRVWSRESKDEEDHVSISHQEELNIVV